MITNIFYKNNQSWLKILPVLILFLAVVILPASANDITLITISETASQEFEPDTCSVTLAVETQAKTAEEAQAQNNELMKQVKSSVIKAGVSEQDILTYNFYVTSIYNNSSRASEKLQKVIGYKATNSIIVKSLPNKSGQIIDTALKAGATSVYSVNFYLKDNSSYKNSVINQAVENALAKANSIAKSLGKQVISIESINEDGNRTYVSENYRAYASKASLDSVPTELNPGNISVTATIQVTVKAK